MGLLVAYIRVIIVASVCHYQFSQYPFIWYCSWSCLTVNSSLILSDAGGRGKRIKKYVVSIYVPLRHAPYTVFDKNTVYKNTEAEIWYQIFPKMKNYLSVTKTK